MGKSPDEMMAAILRNLPAKTGRDAGGWAALIKAEGPAEPKACARWLKQAHGLGGATAQVLAAHALGGIHDLTPEQRLDKLYEGREDLRPIGDRLTALARGLGADVTSTVLSTMVSFSAGLKFAEAKPAGKGRIDLGLALGREPLPPSAVPLTPVKTADASDRITYRIPLASMDAITEEVAAWLARAHARVTTRD
ncbi:DUF5655 domain-containing protein [Nitrospirillum viridazoti]|uniref:DUF5655 domain-containing protein n=1 Tax=Nitrospirillum viridazoti CBAmc TaxID=1441467 RepID=A0A248JT05_9PROT|nr:DUF5655 domain-containing protein [Nitrospirillum amazonense]ASG21238.1 hypothetical protein Y958_10690 [Nitrospirillum amazonense CBAmc]TWB32235.1 uncharacterized protein DUF4287 [Nitrospirillum amazonense]